MTITGRPSKARDVPRYPNDSGLSHALKAVPVEPERLAEWRDAQGRSAFERLKSDNEIYWMEAFAAHTFEMSSAKYVSQIKHHAKGLRKALEECRDLNPYFLQYLAGRFPFWSDITPRKLVAAVAAQAEKAAEACERAEELCGRPIEERRSRGRKPDSPARAHVIRLLVFYEEVTGKPARTWIWDDQVGDASFFEFVDRAFSSYSWMSGCRIPSRAFNVKVLQAYRRCQVL